METLKNLNIHWIDILTLIIVLRAMILGMRQGFTAEFFTFVSAALALIISVYYYSQLSDVIILNFNVTIWFAQILSFILIVLAVRVVMRPVRTAALKAINGKLAPQLEFLGGGLFGIGRGAAVAATLILLLTLTDSDYLREGIYTRSYSGYYLVKAASIVYKSATFWLPGGEEAKEIFITPASIISK